MRRASWIWGWPIALVLGAVPLPAERLTLDPERSEIFFLLRATGHKVRGVLQLSHGEIGFNLLTREAWGEVVIDAQLATTGNRRRDRKMHRRVLVSEAHPTIVFRPERVLGEIAFAGASEFELGGTVTLLGEDHPLSLPTTARVDGERVEAVSSFQVPYVAWGLEDPSTFVLRVAKSVTINLEVAGTLTAD